jgi:uncharacterized protein YjbJ (UPF0337 family)
MTSDIIKGKWHQLKGKVRSQWGRLTDDELDVIDGESERLVGLLQERYGYARDRAKREVDQFLDREARV